MISVRIIIIILIIIIIIIISNIISCWKQATTQGHGFQKFIPNTITHGAPNPPSPHEETDRFHRQEQKLIV